jgi:hypothetical protein
MTPTEITLVPLPVVLFPGMPLPLQVAGEQDKEILQRCQEENGVIGAALVREPTSIGGHPDLHRVGTTARIAGTKDLGEGKLSVLAVGQERFRIIECVHDEPPIRVAVELLGVGDEEERVSSDLVNSAAQLFADYVRLLLSLAEQEEPGPLQLPRNSLHLSYLVAQSLAIGAEEKQRLLEFDTTRERLSEEITILRRENSSSRLLLNFRDKTGRGKVGGDFFSLN